MDDRTLTSQVLAGNRAAFRLLVLRHQRALFRFLRTFGLSPAVTEEIAQESFLRAYRNLASWDPERASFPSWLLTIGRNLALHELERASHRKELQMEGPMEGDDGFDAPSPGDSVQHALEQQSRSTHLHEALDQLPALLRRALVLAYLREVSLEEAASIEGCPVGTIKSRIHRGKALLRAALAGTEV